ncbi:hypothetical protein SAMN06265173_1025 [Thalassovita litoralis]|jgi:hypothetical protein|uniref:Anti-sigma factor NepR domain-containing protein n=1 Tax=Thalassovita litoralis TaxID=1010611 RepID=A0A521B0R7_9RHOB|nr:NepR family anti-sigma factor [Thalassovita litoralis]SMO40676.1 hypothetical protein SAMN06265173_1025 [Thalassovita litoralis]
MTEKQPKSSLEELIDDNLRKVYRQVEDEQVPDRFLELLEKLKQQENTDGT